MINLDNMSENLTKNQYKWFCHYKKLCETRKERGLNKKDLNFYTEKHHIIPKCLGGLDNNENLVLLTANEHFIAHQLLVKIFPNNKKISFACMSMTFDKYGHRYTNKMYEWVKITHAKNNSESRKGKTKETCPIVAKICETKSKKKHYFLGQTKETHPGLASISKKNTGKNKTNCLGRAQQSLKRTGWTKYNHSGTALMAEKKKGQTKENNEGIRKMSETLSGRTKHTHEYLANMAEKNNILSKEQRKEIVHMFINEKMLMSNIHRYLISKNIKIAYSTVTMIIKRELAENQYLIEGE